LNCRIFYHNNCFDGACSASLFTHLHRELLATSRTSAAHYTYQGLVHRAGGLFGPADFLSTDTGDQNAIVDFKYSPSPLVTWWFDHHLSAFLTPEDQQQFEAQQADGTHTLRHFYDPNSISCTGFIARIAATKFGFDTTPLADLIHWADLIDGARYESAQSAVEMAAPAMKLTMVIEGATDPNLIPRIIPLLTAMPLAEVLAQPFIAELLEPLLARHHQAIELIRARATLTRGVLTFDLTDTSVEGYNKFIPYYLHPDATYVVGLSKSAFRTKISVGTNPWTPLPADRLVNLAELCERYGGGGHARVGAISLPPDRAAEARTAAKEIETVLSSQFSVLS
jgi:hypothetical protein